MNYGFSIVSAICSHNWHSCCQGFLHWQALLIFSNGLLYIKSIFSQELSTILTGAYQSNFVSINNMSVNFIFMEVHAAMLTIRIFIFVLIQGTTNCADQLLIHLESLLKLHLRLTAMDAPELRRREVSFKSFSFSLSF